MLLLNTILAIVCALFVLGVVLQAGVVANLFVIQERPDMHPLATLCSEPDGVEVWIDRPDGTRLRALHKGSGPAVLLIHDLGLSSTSMNLLWQALSRHGFRVIAFDLRAHGASSGTLHLKTADMVGDIAAVIDFFRLQQVLVVGHAFGACLAFQYMLRYPDARQHVQSIVSLAGFVGSELHLVGHRGLTRRLLEWGVLQRLLRNRLYAWGYVSPLFGHKITPSLVRAYLDILLKRPLQRLKEPLRELAQTDLYSRLHQITVPVQVVCSRTDACTHPIHAVQLARQLPLADLTWIEDGSGNMLVWECPEQIANLVRHMEQRLHADALAS